jgi:hypothetical protein
VTNSEQETVTIIGQSNTLKGFKKIPFLNTIKRIIVLEECEQWTWGAEGSYLKVAAKQHVISTHTRDQVTYITICFRPSTPVIFVFVHTIKF